MNRRKLIRSGCSFLGVAVAGCLNRDRPDLDVVIKNGYHENYTFDVTIRSMDNEVVWQEHHTVSSNDEFRETTNLDKEKYIVEVEWANGDNLEHSSTITEEWSYGECGGDEIIVRKFKGSGITITNLADACP